jgi:hypothetical protein
MARACSRNRHGGALARAPGRHARPHPGPRPLRLVLGLLAVLALVFAATLMPAVALAEEGDGGAESSDTSGAEGTEGTEGTEGVDSVGLANDEDPGISAGVATGGPADLEGPAASPGYTSPTQHEVAPPGPAGLPSGLPGPPATGIGSFPNMDTLGGLACCPTSGPGGNTGEHGQHESDE